MSFFSTTNPIELMPKPSDALTAMIEGLRDTAQRPDLKIDMLSYGAQHEDGVCYGCAATYAVRHALLDLDPTFTFRDVLNARELSGQWELFENMIDYLRQGHWQDLLRYYDLLDDDPKYEPASGLVYLPRLDGYDWPQHIQDYVDYRDDLKIAGV